MLTVSAKVVPVPPPSATVRPSTLALSALPLVKAMTIWPLAFAVAPKLRAMALLAPPAAAKTSKAERTVPPLIATSKRRRPAAVQ